MRHAVPALLVLAVAGLAGAFLPAAGDVSLWDARAAVPVHVYPTMAGFALALAMAVAALARAPLTRARATYALAGFAWAAFKVRDGLDGGAGAVVMVAAGVLGAAVAAAAVLAPPKPAQTSYSRASS